MVGVCVVCGRWHWVVVVKCIGIDRCTGKFFTTILAAKFSASSEYRMPTEFGFKDSYFPNLPDIVKH